MRNLAGTALFAAVVAAMAPASALAAECPLGEENKVAAAEAFNDVLSVLRHPRCANCHGDFNLYESSPDHPGGRIIEEVTTAPEDDLFGFGEPTTTTTIRGPDYCAGCHGRAEGQWIQKSPGSEIQWARLDDRALWNRLQTTRIVTDRSTMATEDSTGAGLIAHARHDLLIDLAFDGDRAISPDKRIYFDFERDPPPLSKDQFVAALERWVDALDARESWPEGDCSDVLDEPRDTGETPVGAAPPTPPTPPGPGPTPPEEEPGTGTATGETPPEEDKPEEETVTVDPCEQPRADLATADELIAEGDLGTAETIVATIDAGECTEVAEAIPDRESDIAARVDEAVAAVDRAADSCDATTMDTALLGSGDLRHPRIDDAASGLMRAATALIRAEEAYERGSAAFGRGDWSTARSGLLQARAAWESAGAACAPHIQKVDVGISKIDRIAGAEARVAAATAECDLDRMAAYRQELLAINSPHPSQTSLAGRIASDIETCKANDPELRQAAADADCLGQYGSGYSAGEVADDGSYFCVPDRETANAWCDANNPGSGWVARDIKYNGAFDCDLTEAGRNAACAAANGGGWLAGRVQSDGSYNCYMGRSARNAWCRDQYGGAWYSGDLDSAGNFQCFGPSTVTRQPSGGGDPAAAAAAIGSIIGGIIQSQTGGGGGGQNCHRNPTTGQMHCGSN